MLQVRLFLCLFIVCVFVCFAAQVRAQEALPPESTIQGFFDLLEKAQTDPAAREILRKQLDERIQSLEVSPEVQNEIKTKQDRAAELKSELARLEAESEKARAELDTVEKGLAALEANLPAAAAPNDQAEILKQLRALIPVEGESANAVPATPAAAPVEQPADFFAAKVKPILEANCFGCHGGEKQRSELRLDTHDGVLKGGTRGPAVAAGDPASSILIQAIGYEGELKMPPKGSLPRADVDILTEWVRQGAPFGVEAPPPPAPAPTAAPVAAVAVTPASTASRVDFNRDIQPILSDTCFACHGPDVETRKAGMRLDLQSSAFSVLASGHTPVVPGDRGKSELFRRISAADPADRMPPEGFDKSITPEQIELIGKWIDGGAPWAGHWSFAPPSRPAPPAVAKSNWPRNPIDNFILERLEKEGLEPSPETDKRTLIRRATFDLTGLPPTRDEVNAFVEDSSPDSYDKLVDRLLASPRYGEHMARYWLDLARFSDTNGYHIDNERFMWRWRDWVIGAFNDNKPFDQFTIEQLAGDLLPNPTLEQRIATGFNRNHMINFEGGIIPEEYRVQYVVDRVNTTSTVWMGMTVACAQCHDHKYDPVTQREYYGLFAFFNTIQEQGIDGVNGNAVPLIEAPLPEQETQLENLRADAGALREEMRRPIPELDAKQDQWELESRGRLESRWAVLEPLEAKSTGGATLTTQVDKSILVSGTNPDTDVFEILGETTTPAITAIRLEALTDPSLPKGGAGRFENANFVLSEIEIEAAPASAGDTFTRVQIASAQADFSQNDLPVSKAIDGDPASGWGAAGFDKPESRTAVFSLKAPFGGAEPTRFRVRLRFESKFAQHAIGRFRLSVANDPAMLPAEYGVWHVNGPFLADDGKVAYETAYDPETGVDLKATYEDRRLKWIPRPDLADGDQVLLPGDVAATYLYRTITAPTARALTLALGSNDAIKVWLNGEVVHDNNVQRGLSAERDTVSLPLRAGENQFLMKIVNYGGAYAYAFAKSDEQLGEMPLVLEAALLRPVSSESDRIVLRDAFRKAHWDQWAALAEKLTAIETQEAELAKQIPTTMVMAEMPEPRETFLLKRGQYDQPGDKVTPAVPAALSPLPDGAQANRLAFAQWLVSPNHPLTARVTVNRFWMQHFGTGIVKTTEDFGSQGARPTHPQLLDWLACEFQESGWDVKHLHKLMLTSATYRQESRVDPALLEKDPENLLLARGSRYRLDAEMVRDNALAVSGLLVERLGGPSVKPYQPAGLWKEVAYGANISAMDFKQDEGDALYRRSMYTFWKRTAPPPSMMLFDAPNREVCTAHRARTNTPLQALALMNDPQFVEASRALAQRVLKECASDASARIDYAFELATSRPPSEPEKAVLLDLLNVQLEQYSKNPDAAAQLLEVGDSPRDESIDPCEHAAWTLVANTILNLDETVTKT